MLAYYINLIKQQEEEGHPATVHVLAETHAVSTKGSGTEKLPEKPPTETAENESVGATEDATSTQNVAVSTDNTTESTTKSVEKATLVEAKNLDEKLILSEKVTPSDATKRPVGRPRKDAPRIEPKFVDLPRAPSPPKRPSPRKSLAQIEAERIIATIVVDKRSTIVVDKRSAIEQSDDWTVKREAAARDNTTRENSARKNNTRVETSEQQRGVSQNVLSESPHVLSDLVPRRRHGVSQHVLVDPAIRRGPGRPPKRFIEPPVRPPKPPVRPPKPSAPKRLVPSPSARQAVSLPTTPAAAFRLKTTHWGGLIETHSDFSPLVVNTFTFHPQKIPLVEDPWWKTQISLDVVDYEEELVEQLARVEAMHVDTTHVEGLDLRILHIEH